MRLDDLRLLKEPADVANSMPTMSAAASAQQAADNY
jgi:hypothetical protein